MNDLIIGLALGVVVTLLLVSFFWPKKPLQPPQQNGVDRQKLGGYLVREAELAAKLRRSVKGDNEWDYHLHGHYEGEIVTYASIADEFVSSDVADYIDHL